MMLDRDLIVDRVLAWLGWLGWEMHLLSISLCTIHLDNVIITCTECILILSRPKLCAPLNAFHRYLNARRT